jgi:hypothetical protein
MTSQVKLEQDGDKFKLVAKVYIPKHTCLGLTHIKRPLEVINTALGEFLTNSPDPNCMLLEAAEENSLWAVRNIFIGDTISLDYRMYKL